MNTILQLKHYPFLFVLFYFNNREVVAQTPVSFYTFSNKTSVSSVNQTASGWNTTTPYIQSTNYRSYYGQSSGGGNGLERQITGFNVGTNSFSRIDGNLGIPFNKVKVNRHPLLVGDTINTLYEYTSTSGNNIFIAPSYISSLEDVINNYSCNRGSDNLFSNSPTTRSNIERLDLIRTTGIYVYDATMQGFLINERGGNDNFKVAAIVSLNGAQEVQSFGNLLSVNSSAWGRVGPQINTLVMSRRIDTDINLRPKQEVTTQTVSGIYISLADLGITNGSTIYGYSLFPNDVTGAMDLIGLTNVPTTTNQGTDGGLDMLAGMGYFMENRLLSTFKWDLKMHNFNGSTLLKWKNPAPGEIDYFEIEQSNNGSSFKTVGRITVYANDGNEYSFSENSFTSFEGKNYFRLKGVKHDGRTVYSDISNNRTKDLAIELFPNPASDWIQINTYALSDDAIHLEWINEQGQTVLKKTIALHKGENQIRVDLKHTELRKGLYYLAISTDRKRKLIKIIKQ
ncbi:MAG: T9SS type A sorting domain-containing protein [Lacibacter sp.]